MIIGYNDYNETINCHYNCYFRDYFNDYFGEVFNRQFCYITKPTSIWPGIISLTTKKTIITVISAIKISKNTHDLTSDYSKMIITERRTLFNSSHIFTGRQMGPTLCLVRARPKSTLIEGFFSTQGT